MRIAEGIILRFVENRFYFLIFDIKILDIVSVLGLYQNFLLFSYVTGYHEFLPHPLDAVMISFLFFAEDTDTRHIKTSTPIKGHRKNSSLGKSKS